MTGDSEHPACEAVVVTPEPIEAADHRLPGLGRQVFGVITGQDSQVPHQARIQIPPKSPEGLFISGLRSCHRAAARSVRHNPHAIYVGRSAGR